VGFAAVKLLKDAGCEVDVPAAQTCCGQPAYNSGDRATARQLAQLTIAAFEAHDYVVAPSGSCAGMLKLHYAELLADDPAWKPRAARFVAKVHELVSFLVNVRGVSAVDAQVNGRATYHDSCSGLRELGIREQPRKLLRTVRGLELVELKDADVCCGFGGTFSIKYPDISNSIVERKTEHVMATDADMLLAGDLGCLMNMAGKLSRQGRKMAVRHVAEVLAVELRDPAIGAGERS
jgi:L-lactate dehydrogenase complex protein LldE